MHNTRNWLLLIKMQLLQTFYSFDNNQSEMGEIDYEYLPSDKLSAHLLAGGAAGMMEHCAMYPVDCIKVRLADCIPFLFSPDILFLFFLYSFLLTHNLATLHSCSADFMYL